MQPAAKRTKHYTRTSKVVDQQSAPLTEPRRREVRSARKRRGIEQCLEECPWRRVEEDRLRSVFAASPDAIVVTDLNGKVIDFNQAALEMCGGKSDEDLIGKNAFEFIAQKDRQKAFGNLKNTLKRGRIKNVEYSLVTRNGQEYWAELSSSVVRDEAGTPISFVAVIKDVNERKHVEEALRESEERYRSVVDNIGIGVSVISPRMEILALNKQMKEWFPQIDTSKRPICYRAFNKPPRKNVCSYCPTFKTLRDGKIHESITETPQGKRIINYRVVSSPIKDRSGKITAAIEMVDDITKRRKMEEKLQHYSRHLKQLVKERTRRLEESETRFGSVSDHASEAIITINQKGIIVFWNKAARNIFGYSMDEALGKPITFIMPNWARERYKAAARRFASRKKKRLAGKTFELTGFKKDGTEFPMELSFSVWKTKEGNFYTSVIRDNTEHKKIEDERKQYEQTLSALNSCGGKLNAAKSLDEVYELTLGTMEQTLGFEHAAFMAVDGNKLRRVHQRGYPGALNFALSLNEAKGITVRAVVTRLPCLVPDVTKDEGYVKSETKGPDIRSELAVPVIIDDQVLGVLNVESTQVGTFNEKDVMLLQILASHAGTAIGSLKKRDEIAKRSSQQASLMKSSTEMIHSTELRHRLQAILDAVKGLGWRRVVLSVRQENLDIGRPEDIVTAGLTKEEEEFLWTSRRPGHVWSERFGPDFERFKIGEFYYLPWSDPLVRKRFSQGTVASHLEAEEMVDWDPDDLLYAPLRLADGRIVGVISMDDPVDGRRPSRECLEPLELFLHQAAVAIENARLIKQLNDAKAQIQGYAQWLEVKVDERTRELKKTQNRLLRTERLAAIGELAGMVGHDLRNPLTGISGAAYYVRTKYGPGMDEKGKEMLKVIEKDIAYSNKIIDDLLEYSREIRLRLTKTNPKSLVKEALSYVDVRTEIIILDKTAKRPTIRVDAEKMRRVLINIIKNAVDAMPDGGTLTIESGKVENSLALSFSDTGIGMPSEVMNKLWTPLFTTKARGMGFGLPICKRIVESHGGKICVESEVKKGTTFTLTIPLEPKTEEEKEGISVRVAEIMLNSSKS